MRVAGQVAKALMRPARVRWQTSAALLFLLVAGGAGAGDLSTGFDQANRLYEKGNYPGAAAAYESLLGQGRVSSAILFNLGNARFKTGEKGRAIAAYRAGLRWAPRDSILIANLQFVRSKVDGAGDFQPEAWRRGLERLTLDEWTLLAVGFGWPWLFLLAVQEWKPALRSRLNSYTRLLAFLTFCSGLALAAACQSTLHRPAAVVITTDAVARYGPLDESQSSFILHDGAEVLIRDRKNDWLQIEDAARRTGWLKTAQVVPVH